MTPDDFRGLALSLEGAVEGAHMGQPDFRVNGRIFATLAAQSQGKAMVKLPLEDQAMRVETASESFAPVPGGWGRMGCTHILLAAADEAAVRGALAVAWRLQAEKRPTKARKKR